MVETQTERKVKILYTDNGMEFCSNKFDEFCSNDGMVRHHTIPYTPQHNGVAERMNGTIISRARCTLSNAKMHRRFFGLKQPPPHVISSTGHLPFHLIRKLPLRYGLVHQLIILS
jgi:transposase InsO family protein